MTYKCEKCRDTGIWETGNNDLPCECPAGKTALFNVAGFAHPVRGADLDRLDRSHYCLEHHQYSCVVCAAGKPSEQHPIIEKEALDALQTEIGSWSDTTFPNSTPRTMFLHLQKELRELEDELGADEIFPNAKTKGTAHEIADCIMLLLHLAHRKGISARDAIREKFEICKKRKWGPPDKDGVVQHVEE